MILSLKNSLPFPLLSEFLLPRKFLLLPSFMIARYSTGVEPLGLLGVSACYDVR